jgi:hypothetical protein
MDGSGDLSDDGEKLARYELMLARGIITAREYEVFRYELVGQEEESSDE